jgi:hypothetical protein
MKVREAAIRSPDVEAFAEEEPAADSEIPEDEIAEQEA